MPIPYAVDPSLHGGPPPPMELDDGFHPPARTGRDAADAAGVADAGVHRQDLATHPVEPATPPPGEPEPAEPNPSRLPVEPEFAPGWRPAEPEDPGTHPPLP